MTNIPTSFPKDIFSPIVKNARIATRKALEADIATVGPAGPLVKAILIEYIPIARAIPAKIGRRRYMAGVFFKFS